MDYYRKAAAIFILVITLILPVFLENEKTVAVVEVQTLLQESSYLNSLLKEKKAENKEEQKLKKEMILVIKDSAAEYAAENNYSSVISKDVLYQGGTNITDALIKKLDRKN